MKAIKIDIVKEYVNIPDGRPYRVVTTPPLMAMKVGEIPGEMKYKEETYFPRKVYNPLIRDTEIYLVKRNEDKLFGDLMTVGDGMINERIKEAVDAAEENMFYKTQSKTLYKIKSLPWYIRLFNCFNEESLI